MSTQALDSNGHRIDISNVEKPIYPADGVTKGDVVAYYQAVAEIMLPHLRGRPLSMRRFPDGVDGEGFFQKEASRHFPDWVRTLAVPQRSGHADVNHVMCDDAATVLYLANQACLEFHTSLSTEKSLERPDRLVIDIDPPEGVDPAELRDVARRARQLLESVDLTAFVQATGGSGFHVVAALDGAADYEIVRPFARELADELARQDADRLTTEQRKDRRGARIFLDANRNAYGQTTITPYSLRARPGGCVATPLDWQELGRAEPRGYRLDSIKRRLAHKGDPWRDLAEFAGSAARARRQLIGR